MTDKLLSPDDFVPVSYTHLQGRIVLGAAHDQTARAIVHEQSDLIRFFDKPASLFGAVAVITERDLRTVAVVSGSVIPDTSLSLIHISYAPPRPVRAWLPLPGNEPSARLAPSAYSNNSPRRHR